MPLMCSHRVVMLMFLALVSVDAISMRGGAGSSAAENRQGRQLPVWVHAYARSGSSTMLSMVSQASDSPYMDSAHRDLNTTARVFSLFEPCHYMDKYVEGVEAGAANAKDCPKVLMGLARCQFDKVRWLHAWDDVHTKKLGAGAYKPASASDACSTADIVTFKTVARAHENFTFKANAQPVLDGDERLRLITIVRDPRSIYASWMTTWPFNTEIERNVTAMLSVCDSFASNVDVKHARAIRVKFERLVQEPQAVMKEVYSFLGARFGEPQERWIKLTFGAKDCPGVDQWIAPYSDCHTNSASSVEKWRGVLTDAEKEAFAKSRSCQAVAKTFGYPLF